MRSSALVLCLLASPSVACHSRSGPPAQRLRDASAKPGVTPVAGPTPAARFSRPIAAVRGASGVTFVAGLAVSTSTIALTAIGPDGVTRWTRDAITGVTWGPNAAVSTFAAGTGAVVTWRGQRNGQEGTVASEMSADGKLAQEPYAVGAAACTTDAQIAWIDHGARGSWLVKTRAFGTSVALTTVTLPEDREPALLCSAHRVFAFGDGDEDVTLSIAGEAPRAMPLRVILDADFRGDEEEGHEVYAVGDAVGVVRMGLTGSVAVREITGQGHSPWRRFGKKLALGDDLALVDGDDREAILVFTREVLGGGEGSGRSSVLAFVWERSGTRSASYELGAPDGAYERGPFWSGAVKRGIVVAWVERGVRADAGQAPVIGLAYRVVSLDALGDVHRILRPADDLVDAGCDDARCYAVALARAIGEDGGQPEIAAVLSYP